MKKAHYNFIFSSLLVVLLAGAAQAGTVLEAGRTTVTLSVSAMCDRTGCYLDGDTETLVVPEEMKVYSIETSIWGDNRAYFWIDHIDADGVHTSIPPNHKMTSPPLPAGTYNLTLLAGSDTWGFTTAGATVTFTTAMTSAAALATTPLPAPVLMLGGALLALGARRHICRGRQGG